MINSWQEWVSLQVRAVRIGGEMPFSPVKETVIREKRAADQRII